MKKFKFSLESVLKIKLARETQKQSELGAIEFNIENTLSELNMVIKVQENLFSALDSKKSMDAVSLIQYDEYKKVLKEKIAAINLQLEKLYKEKEVCQQQLITIIKERKAMEKLREKQFAEYLRESQKEYEREIGDFMSFHSNNPLESGGQAS